MDLLIFDFDGLILDTETAAFESWTEIFRSHNATLPLPEWAKCIGTTNDEFDVYAYLEKQVGRPLDRRELRRRYSERAEGIVRGMEPRPGVVDYLKEAQKLRIAMAVASSSHQDWVMGHLSRLGLADCFHSIRTADDVAKVKPDPELYQLTLTTMGVSPRQALAFEDSPNGIKAAKAAGVNCVAVPNAITRELPLPHTDRRIESMAEISLRELLHQLETARGKG